MAVTYEKTFEIEIINELSASVYNRVLNYVLNHELNKNDSQLLEVNLLNQLKLAKRGRTRQTLWSRPCRC